MLGSIAVDDAMLPSRVIIHSDRTQCSRVFTLISTTAARASQEFLFAEMAEQLRQPLFVVGRPGIG